MKGILGKKLGMTQVFDSNGVKVGVTVIQAGPCPVIQKKTMEKDRYCAIQLGFDAKREKSTTKPLKGHFDKAQVSPRRYVREIRLNAEELANYEVGKELKCDIFAEGDRVDVVGVEKGRGFQGVMRRHNFTGYVASHGAHEYQRHGGAIGQHTWPARVYRGKRMPGHMGCTRTTVRNIKILKILPEENLILVRGGIPGHRNGYVMIIQKD